MNPEDSRHIASDSDDPDDFEVSEQGLAEALTARELRRAKARRPSDNPEWTAEDFAKARPIADFPELSGAFPNGNKAAP